MRFPPEEFGEFINENIKLDPIILSNQTKIKDLLTFYMGTNTMERQQFIIDKLRVEKRFRRRVG